MLFYSLLYCVEFPGEQTIVYNAHHPRCPLFAASSRVIPLSVGQLSAMPTVSSPIVHNAIVSNAHCLQPNHWQRHCPPHKCRQYPSSVTILFAALLSADQLSAMPIVSNAHRPRPHRPRGHCLRRSLSVVLVSYAAPPSTTPLLTISIARQ